MLDEVGVSHNFWGDAVHAAVYLPNITQLKPNSHKTRYELWKGRPALVKHIKVFGSKCFIKRNEKNPRKFDSHADKGILLGYSIQRKGYKCYNKWTRRIEDCINIIGDKVGAQPEFSKNNMNSDDEGSSDLRSTDLNEIDSDSEGEEAGTSSRPKATSRYVQKEHHEIQILGDQRQGVQTRRKLVGNTSCANLALLSQIEPENLCQAREDKFWGEMYK